MPKGLWYPAKSSNRGSVAPPKPVSPPRVPELGRAKGQLFLLSLYDTLLYADWGFFSISKRLIHSAYVTRN